MSFKKKLIKYFILTATILLAGVWILSAFTASEIKSHKNIAMSIILAEKIENIRADYNAQIIEATKYMSTDNCNMEKYDSLRSNIKNIINELIEYSNNLGNENRKRIISQSRKNEIEDIKKTYNLINSTLKEVFILKNEEDLENAKIQFDAVKEQKFAEKLAGLKIAFIDNEQNKKFISSLAKVQKKPLNYWATLTAALMLSGIFIAGRNLHKTIYKVFRKINHSILEINKGNYSTKISSGNGPDFKVLVNNFNVMSAGINKIISEQNLKLRDLNAKEKNLRQISEFATLSDRAKSKFLASISHNIRTPLNSIIGSNNLMKNTSMSKEQAEYVNNVESSSQLILGTIDNILNMARLDQAELVAENVVFNLEDIVADSMNYIKPKLDEKSVQIYANIHKDIPASFEGDSTLLKQILINLLDNSAKFTEKGKIGVLINKIEMAGNDGNMFEFRVVDTGCGISQKEIKNIFNFTASADNGISKKYASSGLGLSICKIYSETLGGQIEVDSKKDEGTTVKFTVKLKPGLEETISHDDYNGYLKDKTVLIFQDSMLCNEIAAKICLEYAMVPMTFNKTSEMESKIMELSGNVNSMPDFAIIDLDALEKNHFDFLLKIKSDISFYNMKVIGLSNSSSFNKKELNDLGLDYHLEKPLLRKRILNALVSLSKDTVKEDLTEKDSQSDKFRILIAEDNLINRKLAIKTIENLGYECETAENGKQVIEKCRENEYDLILMDMMMPVMDGIEATRVIRKEVNAEIPIIAFTAAALREDQDKAVEAGMNDYLTKPIEPKILSEKISKWCRSYKESQHEELSPEDEKMMSELLIDEEGASPNLQN